LQWRHLRSIQFWFWHWTYKTKVIVVPKKPTTKQYRDFLQSPWCLIVTNSEVNKTSLRINIKLGNTNLMVYIPVDILLWFFEENMKKIHIKCKIYFKTSKIHIIGVYHSIISHYKPNTLVNYIWKLKTSFLALNFKIQ